MENGNGRKLEHRLTTLEEGQKNQVKQLDSIELQVTNHIPTAIKELGEKIDKRDNDIRKDVDSHYSKKWVEVVFKWGLRALIAGLVAYGLYFIGFHN